MARRSSSQKILPSLWRNLLRRQRRRVQPKQVIRRTRKPIRRLSKPIIKVAPAPWYVHTARISIVLLGSGAIAGTLMSWTQLQMKKPAVQLPVAKKVAKTPLLSLKLGKQQGLLQEKMQELAIQYPKLELYLFVQNLTSGEYVDLGATQAVSGASTIKIPIAMALLQQVDQGKIKLEEQLVLKKSAIAAGSGTMNSMALGSKVTVRAALQASITISDNTATNLLIERLGGSEKLNLQWQSWGLVATTLRSPLPDFTGTNQVSGRELAMVLQQLDKGNLLSPTTRQTALDIFRQTKRNHLLPKGLNDPTAKVAHKTGELDSLLADAGLIELAGGKKYIVVALVKRDANNEQAESLIRQVAAAVRNSATVP
jgi:beta-lactamase class A